MTEGTARSSKVMGLLTEGTTRSSKLAGLLVDSEGVDAENFLFGVLDGRIAFEKTSGRILPRPSLYDLPGRKRLLILFVARHAATKLGLPSASIWASPSSLAAEAQMPLKTVGEYLSRLKSRGLVEKGADGYSLPAWNLLRAGAELEKAE
jgi:hypothetical protein